MLVTLVGHFISHRGHMGKPVLCEWGGKVRKLSIKDMARGIPKSQSFGKIQLIFRDDFMQASCILE